MESLLVDGSGEPKLAALNKGPAAPVGSSSSAYPVRAPGFGWSGDPAEALDLLGPFGIFVAADAVGLGVVVLWPDGRLVYANVVANKLLRSGEALVLDPAGLVRCRDPRAQASLSRLLRTARLQSPGRQKDGPSVVAIPRRDGRPLAALAGVSRCRGTARWSGEPAERRTVTLLIRDPDRSLVDCAARIGAVFGLSRSEADVAAFLAAGATLQEAADGRGVTLTTVRNQLKAAMAKIGVARQAELVSVVLRTVQF